MGEMLEVERLDRASACSLAERLTEQFATPAKVRGGENCCVQLKTESAPLGDLLHALEEWTTLAGMPSVHVRLNGRTYILECRVG
jgi:hypothetical protein